MNNGFCIGIDLHGTLLNRQEKIEEKFHQQLFEVLKKLKEKSKIFVCTGNDLPFVKEVIPEKIFSLLDGCVLETGCVVSEGDMEVIKTPENIQKMSQELRRELENKKFPEVTEFRRRLTTASLFCENPKEFFKKIDSFIRNSKYNECFSTTYSSVAVDVIPKGFDKFVGMKMASLSFQNRVPQRTRCGTSLVSKPQERKSTVPKENDLQEKDVKIAGIADSMNDFNLLAKSDFSFVPANCPEEVIEKLKLEGKKIKSIKDVDRMENGVILKSDFKETEGVVEILNFINKYL